MTSLRRAALVAFQVVILAQVTVAVADDLETIRSRVVEPLLAAPDAKAVGKLIEHTAATNEHWQQRIAAARKNHTKQTRKKLRKMGIYFKDLIRCRWPKPAQ